MATRDDDREIETPQQGHMPVMLSEAVKILAPRDGECYLDCTFGGGGHTRAILESADCKVFSIDRDAAAAKRAESIKDEFGDRFEFINANFSQLDKLQTDGYAGVLFDFGVSSFQLDDSSRGFSIMRDGPLDMRMNREEGESALEFVNGAPEDEIAKVLRAYGEERRASAIARAIVRARAESPIETTSELAGIAGSVSHSRERIHPATRTFQAIRIKVNNELGEIEEALPKAFSALKRGGILAAISFHSLEDRIVKRFFKSMAGLPQDRFDRSYAQDRVKRAELITRKPLRPSEGECKMNPRSRSAKLRAIKKESL